jgi:hypothetical protein
MEAIPRRRVGIRCTVHAGQYCRSTIPGDRGLHAQRRVCFTLLSFGHRAGNEASMKRILVLPALLLAIGVLLAASPNAALEPPVPADYSKVTTQEAALALVAEGRLAKVLLFPEEFGGRDVAANTVYVPIGIVEIKEKITGTLIRYYEDELIDKLSVKPEYKGDSVIPSRIVMTATHSTKSGKFEPSIEIW